MISSVEHLDKASLGVFPNPFKLARALMRPNQPFVMINMLSYKPKASGAYSHLSGAQAYELYAQSVEKVQGPLGSRLIWSGQVHPKTSEGEMPTFDSIGLLEYASPRKFLQANFTGQSNTQARSAGLNGQWLIAATTLEEGPCPDPAEGHIVLIELSGGLKQHPEAGKQWKEDRRAAYRQVGAKTLWNGHCDRHVLGSAMPRIEDACVTWFPGLSAISDAMVAAHRDESMQSMRPHLAYTACSIGDFLPALR